MSMNRRGLAFIAGGVCLAIGVASVIPGPWAGVAVSAGATEPPVVVAGLGEAETAILTKTCGNCHSNQTEWPWYSEVAPASWLIRKDVSDGRRFLNFSLWAQYGADGQSQLLTLSAARVRDSSMPPLRYLALHPEARMNDAQRRSLAVFMETAATRLNPQGAVPNPERR